MDKNERKDKCRNVRPHFWYDEDNYATPTISRHMYSHDECSILFRFYISTLEDRAKCVYIKKIRDNM
jgi:hypothetical protein